MACVRAGITNAGVLALTRALYGHSGVAQKEVRYLAHEVGAHKLQFSSCAWRQQFGLRGFANTAEDIGCATTASGTKANPTHKLGTHLGNTQWA